MLPLSSEQIETFRRDGFLVVEGYFDVEREIEPIRRGVFEIIGMVATDHGIDIGERTYTPETFDAGYRTVKAADRRLGGVIYDAVKQLAPFVRLTATEKNERTFAQLRGGDVIGIAGGGSGIRIDNPDESTYIAPWHQEYPAQFRSLDGVVFWSPLRTVTPELGPVVICKGSHKEGLIKVYSEEESALGRSGAYALRLVNEDETVNRYEHVEPLAKPGDVVLMDFLTVHRSGHNRSGSSRWSMQLRYFNFQEQTGRNIGWNGAYSAGNSINEIHPGLHIENIKSQ